MGRGGTSFTRMHATWLHALCASGASGREVCVFAALTRFESKEKPSTFSRPVSDIAEECCLTSKQTSDVIAALKGRVFTQSGEPWTIIDMVEKPHKGHTTVYRVNVPKTFDEWDMTPAPTGKKLKVKHSNDAILNATARDSSNSRANATNASRSNNNANATCGDSSNSRANATCESAQCYDSQPYPIEDSIEGNAATPDSSLEGNAAPSIGGSSVPPSSRTGSGAPPVPLRGSGRAKEKRTDPESDPRFSKADLPDEFILDAHGSDSMTSFKVDGVTVYEYRGVKFCNYHGSFYTFTGDDIDPPPSEDASPAVQVARGRCPPQPRPSGRIAVETRVRTI